MGVQLLRLEPVHQQRGGRGQPARADDVRRDGSSGSSATCSSKNIKNVELYGYPSNPFPGTNPATPLNTAGLQALRTLGDSYGLRFVSRHGNIAEANWDQEIQAAKILGQEVIGAADPPGIGNLTYQGALSLAELMNRLGKRSVEGGVGPLYFHNHATSFNRKFTDAGVQKYPWEVLMDHTDPRYVKAQIDLFWLASGVSNDNADDAQRGQPLPEPPRVLPRQGRRATRRRRRGTGNLRALGDGAVNFAPIFAAAKNRVRYYLYEYDPVTVGNNGGFNPFTTTDRSLANLTGAPAPVAGTNTPSFTSVPAGTAAAANQVPVKVTNIGDAPLVFTTAAPTIAAEADDGGNATAADFAVVSQDCSGTDPRRRRGLHDQRRLQADAHEDHVGRASAVQLELRRLARPRAADRHEHRRRAGRRRRRRRRPCSR